MQRKRSQRLTYLLRSAETADAHSGGINALCLSSDGASLFTGSRDGSVRCWRAGKAAKGGRPACAAVFEGHADWVTSLTLLPDSSGVLASGSCDGTVRLWRAGATPAPPAAVSPLATLRRHGDYVTAVAAVQGASCFASAGLGGEVHLWDAAVCCAAASDSRVTPASIAVSPPPNGDAASRASIYALAVAPGSAHASPVVLTGDAAGVIRLWDTRAAPATHLALRGHSDTVRALLFDAAGRRCVSGGADRSLRLWDMRSARQLARIGCHSDSVWAVAADASFSTVWSGGRDGAVWATALTGGYEDDGAATDTEAPVLSRARSCLVAHDGARHGAGTGAWRRGGRRPVGGDHRRERVAVSARVPGR